MLPVVYELFYRQFVIIYYNPQTNFEAGTSLDNENTRNSAVPQHPGNPIGLPDFTRDDGFEWESEGNAPRPSADDSPLLTEKTQILQRWAKHFRGLLNRHSNTSDAVIARLPQVETNMDLDLPPSLQETIRAVQQPSSGKVPGSDAIPAEVYEHGCPQLMDHLTALFQEMWRQDEVPQDFKDATIVHL
nr:unnamed protein product [Spirometra erinaceieuropaei]